MRESDEFVVLEGRLWRGGSGCRKGEEDGRERERSDQRGWSDVGERLANKRGLETEAAGEILRERLLWSGGLRGAGGFSGGGFGGLGWGGGLSVVGVSVRVGEAESEGGSGEHSGEGCMKETGGCAVLWRK